LGEGLGGVTVQVPGSVYFAVTANSGGYAVPVTTNGNYAMSFSVSGLPATQAVATVTSLRNVKVDYVLAYSPPVISGPNPAALSADDSLRCVVVRGAGERAFSPGNDIAEFATERSSKAQAIEYGRIMHATAAALARCRHPLVAQIHGICVGGGLESPRCAT
jgi:hypothetical protein